MSAYALGKILGESDTDYHATPAISKSKLDDFIYLPALYHAKHIAKTIPSEETEALDIGRAVHALTLEGSDAYSERFATVPEDAPKRPTAKQVNAKKPSPETLAGIDFWQEFNHVNGNKTILSPKAEQVAQGCAAGIHANPTASMLLNGAETEVSWRVQASSMLMQCRTDIFGRASDELCALMAAQGIIMTPGEPYCADIKTTPALGIAELRGWNRKFAQWGYHRQGPFYQSVIKDVLGEFPERFFFIVVAKEAPHACAVMLPDDEANECGWAEVATALASLRRCYATDEWPALPAVVQRLAMPPWYGKDAE